MSRQSMDVTYAETWSRRKRAPHGPLDRAEALGRHEAGEPYVALLSDGDRPFAFVTLHLKVGAVAVGFLDEQLREELDYTFAVPEGSARLFLQRSVLRVFGDDEQVAYTETHFFRPEEPIEVHKTDAGSQVRHTFKVEADLAANWEPIPEFGRYESIARKERDQATASA
jgi:hypothetical protein